MRHRPMALLQRSWRRRPAAPSSPEVASWEEVAPEDAAADEVTPEEAAFAGPVADQPSRTASATGEIVLRSTPCVGSGVAGATEEVWAAAGAVTATVPMWAGGPAEVVEYGVRDRGKMIRRRLRRLEGGRLCREIDSGRGNGKRRGSRCHISCAVPIRGDG